jgi:hypothetical protein
MAARVEDFTISAVAEPTSDSSTDSGPEALSRVLDLLLSRPEVADLMTRKDIAPVFCVLAGDPRAAKGWPPYNYGELLHALQQSHANERSYYISTALVTHCGLGEVHNRKEDAQALLAVFLDDVGSKADHNALEPTFVLETSPGNFQYWYVFRLPIENVALADRLVRTIYAQEALTDPHGKLLTKFGRLPCGWNGKVIDGKVVDAPVRISGWSGRLFDMEELLQAWNLELAPSRSAPKAVAPYQGAAEEDPLVRAMYECGYAGSNRLESYQGGYKLRLDECVWAHDHMTGGPDGAVLFLDGDGFRYHCAHGGCQAAAEKGERSSVALLEKLTEEHGLAPEELDPERKAYRRGPSAAQAFGGIQAPPGAGAIGAASTDESSAAGGGDDEEDQVAPRRLISISINKGDLAWAVRHSIKALGQADPPLVYKRGGTLCQVLTLDHDEELFKGKVRIPAGTTVLHQVTKHGVLLPLSQVAEFYTGVNKPSPADPSVRLCETILDTPSAWGPLKPLRGVSSVPLIDAVGGIHDRPGYHPHSQMFYDGSAPLLQVPETVDHKMALRARDRLLEPFREFKWYPGTEEVALSVVLSYILTLITRFYYALAPLHAIGATVAGAGKGLVVETGNLLVRGHDAAITVPVSGRESNEELRKRITALLLRGVDSVLVDNIESVLGGPIWNALLTAGEWTDRILGGNDTASLPTRVTWAVTGNGISVRGDQIRRTVLATLDPNDEHPERRQFSRHLPTWVLQHRGELLSAAFTILRGYRQAGSPQDGLKLLGRFEDWSRTVVGPIRWLGMPDPTDSQQGMSEEDPEAERLHDLLLAIRGLFGMEPFTSSDLQAAVKNGGSAEDFKLKPSGAELQKCRTALYEALLAVAGDGNSVSPHRLGRYLGGKNGRICRGLKLVKKAKPDSKTSRSVYSVMGW